VPTYRATDWEVVAVSLEPIPADITVGVGRTSEQAPNPVNITRPHPAGSATTQERRMDPEELEGQPAGSGGAQPPTGGEVQTRTAQPQTTTVVRDRARDTEEGKQIAQYARKHGKLDQLPEWLERGMTLQQVKDEILDGRGAEDTALPAPKKRLDLSDKEAKRYSLARALSASFDQDWTKAGFEREVSTELASQMHKEAGREARGVCVPTEALQIRREFDVNDAGLLLSGADRLQARAAMTSTAAGAAAELVFTKPGSFIEMLRNIAQVINLGATLLPGLRGNIAFPRQTGGASAEWIAENPGADPTETNATFALLNMTPRTLMATVAVTRQMLAQATENVALEDLIRRDIAIAHALGLDFGALAGPGTANNVTGILNAAGVNLVALGVNGAAPSWDRIVELETVIAEANADIGTQAILTTPGLRGTMKKTQKFANTNGDQLWEGSEVNGYQARITNQVPKNLTKGTGTNLHALIQGVWQHLFIGEWGILDIIVDPYAKKKRGIVEMTSFQMADVAVRYPACFAVWKDAIRS